MTISNQKMQIRLKQKIYREVSKIKRGQTRTYKQIAKICNTSPRAVAKILSSNPNPIVVPCHRVIRSDGKLGGYTFKGKRKDKMKEKLLREERIKIKNLNL
jgi:O-6-methylguanine DNA methyltransferase